MTKLSDYKSSTPAITGSTTINHEVRVKLGLNCSEYVLLDHMARKEENNSQADTLTVFIQTGFIEEEIKRLFSALVVKGFVRIDSGNFRLTSKFADSFADIEKEFNLKFWVITDKNEIGKDIVVSAWPGSRKKALEYYIRLRKKHTFDFMISQRDDYFKYLKMEKKYRNFDRQKMMCQVFLNPANERYLENYPDYIKQIEDHYGVKPESATHEPLTKEEVNSQYGKNNHK